MTVIADFRTFPIVSPIVAVRPMAGFVEVEWRDGRVSPFHDPWLRDNCPCPACVYEVTREQVFQIADVAALKGFLIEPGKMVTAIASGIRSTEQHGSSVHRR